MSKISAIAKIQDSMHHRQADHYIEVKSPAAEKRVIAIMGNYVDAEEQDGGDNLFLFYHSISAAQLAQLRKVRGVVSIGER